jgi:4-amino-4-deoxychorismate lyase
MRVTEAGRTALLALAVGGRGLVDPGEPVLRADDDALLRGRAAFETLRVYGGSPFRLDDHIARLAASAERLELPPVDRATFRELAAVALAGGGAPDASLRLYWTPGREGAGQPIALALVSAIPPHLEELRARGIVVVALSLGIDADRRQVAPWLLGGVKSTSYAVNMAAEREARRRGADDAIFLASRDIVLEGPVTNVWWRAGEVLYTPSLDLGILAGVTRATVLELAPALGYRVEEGAFPLAALAAAEEAFTSSSVREIMPAVRLDHEPLGDASPGPAARALQTALRRAADAS